MDAKDLQSYPDAESIKVIDGVVVVKRGKWMKKKLRTRNPAADVIRCFACSFLRSVVECHSG